MFSKNKNSSKRWKMTLDIMFEKYNPNPKQNAKQCPNYIMEDRLETKCTQT
jgi:hypothetical protein